MRDASLLGPWVRRFLMEHMVERAESRPEYPAELPRHLAAVAPGHRRARPQADRSPGRRPTCRPTASDSS